MSITNLEEARTQLAGAMISVVTPATPEYQLDLGLLPQKP